MKKIAIILLSIILIVFIGCNGNKDNAKTEISDNNKEWLFPVVDHGKLQFSFPQEWSVLTYKSELNWPVIQIDSDDNTFRMLITPFWQKDKPNQPWDLKAIREMVETDASIMISEAVENEYTIKEFKANRSQGYYFAPLTDSNYVEGKSGDYRYAVQSGIGIDELMLRVTILFNNKDTEHLSKGFEILKNIKHTQ